ncbi:Predicted phospholipase, patatin/cPLA2 family [Clostridium collagenovorans DSM 3089]|uniref:Predicted phospholipase, patatin/cPLA2 family n=1 Tax=Clostridium collagenovorans DSM 3089 TaxID=1121306 RepID=A0A1M5UVM0_9CLOT|nr:patatin family protein [Clostridium collagenovorans]SHH66999.1 Predicted phospholipase, patatin/cPLA2 family [Clostridium collagenovorans DSM 3089]
MPSLILEGGTFRPIFSAGVMDALLDNNIMFPYCIGVSAGITNGFSYLSKQKRRNLDILEQYRQDKRYLGISNYFRCKSLFGLDFVFDEIPNKLCPFDMDTFMNYEGKAVVGVTNAKTGETEYLDGKLIDDKCSMLRATCALPIFFPVIKIGENEYYDGGICDPIPIRKAIADGNEKHLIILTRPKSYRKSLSKNNIVASKLICKRYPKLKEPLLTRHIQYNKTVKFCEELEAQGKAIILRPSEEGAIESFEKDIDKLRAGYNHGYNLALENLEAIKSLFK